MTKREMLHVLIDKLLDIEETGTSKELSFNYLSPVGFDFHFYEGNGSRAYCAPSSRVYISERWSEEKTLEQFNLAISEIERIKNIPDVEPKINLNLSVSKARELGLIS